jgi:hypothetical protein
MMTPIICMMSRRSLPGLESCVCNQYELSCIILRMIYQSPFDSRSIYIEDQFKKRTLNLCGPYLSVIRVFFIASLGEC